MSCAVHFAQYNFTFPRWASRNEAIRSLWSAENNTEIGEAGWCGCNGNLNKFGAFSSPKWGQMYYKTYNITYCHMNMFRIRDLWRLPALADYDWVINLDTDLYVNKTLPYDPIVKLQEMHAVVGALSRGSKGPERQCETGEQEAIEHIWKIMRVKPVEQQPAGAEYSGNFFIAYLPFFRSDVYHRQAELLLEKTTGIWSHRWSDQAFYTQALSVCYPKRAVHIFNDLRASGTAVHRSEMLSALRGSAPHVRWHGAPGLQLAKNMWLVNIAVF